VETQLEKALIEIRTTLGEERVKTDQETLSRYSIDAVLPKAVAYPKDTRQVAAVVTAASREGLFITPMGGGTKRCIGAPPTGLDLVVSMERMNHMLDVDVANLTITVEAGVRFRDIQARLATQEDRCYLPLEEIGKEADELICSERAHSGCFLPLDPPFSDRATIGGIIAANSSGPRRLLYGLPRDLVLGVRFVTPKGDIVGAGGKTVKNVSGYDVSKLMIGSYGTLGILCEMTLRLLPLPEAMETLIFGFSDAAKASGFAEALLRTKLLPAAVEVMNPAAIEAVRVKSDIPTPPGGCFAATALEGCREAVDRMKRETSAMADHFGATGKSALTEESHNVFWLSLGNIQALAKANYKNLVALKLTYPISEGKALYNFCRELLEQEALPATIVQHAGSGVTLINIMPRADGQTEEMVKVIERIRTGCREKGGFCILECAPPALKRLVPVWEDSGGAGIITARIRKTLDPTGAMNPGRFFPSSIA
jgi:glycolate oxidase FAD binding subunit